MTFTFLEWMTGLMLFLGEAGNVRNGNDMGRVWSKK